MKEEHGRTLKDLESGGIWEMMGEGM